MTTRPRFGGRLFSNHALNRMPPIAQRATKKKPQTARNIIAARRGIRRDEDQSKFRAEPPELALFGDIGMGAGQPGQIPNDRKPLALRMIG